MHPEMYDGGGGGDESPSPQTTSSSPDEALHEPSPLVLPTAAPERPPLDSSPGMQRVPSVVYQGAETAAESSLEHVSSIPVESSAAEPSTPLDSPDEKRDGKKLRWTLKSVDPNWRRRHAWNWPWDPYLVMNYIVSILLMTTFPVLIMVLPDKPVAYWTQVSLFLVPMGLALVLGVYIGVCDTEDTHVKRANMPRDTRYVMRKGERVIDRKTGICHVCRVKPPDGTHHCKRCNKCVRGHDHHCRWLNVCIARGNRAAFNFMLTSFVIGGAVYLAVMLRVIIYLFRGGWDQNGALEVQVSQTFKGLPPKASTVAALRAATILLFAIGVMCYAGILQLSLLHVKLLWRGITTTEWLRERRKQKRAARRAAAKASGDSGVSSMVSEATRVEHVAYSAEKLPPAPAHAAPSHGKVSKGGNAQVVTSLEDGHAMQVGQVMIHVRPGTDPTESEGSDALWG